MFAPPETKFTQSNDVAIAYQVLGEGPFDLVVVPGFVSHLEYAWEDPAYARFLQRLASFSRLILFDKQGTGLSDRITGIPTLEQRMDDVRTVMDAVGSQRAALFGISEGGAMSVLFAATYPERTSALVLYGTIAIGWVHPKNPWRKWTLKELEAGWEVWRKEWGGPVNFENWGPSVVNDERLRQWWAKFLRLSSGPTTVINLSRMYAQIDISDILPIIHVPTLVMHRADDRIIAVEQGRYLAEHIPGAKYVELSGEDHLWWVNADILVDEIQVFLTGERQAVETDRTLATVLFTDIVDSTTHAAEMGDRRWRDLLDSHNAMMYSEISKFRGRMVHSTGDGFLATFDGPARAIRCAMAVSSEARRMGIEIRAGLHAGEIEIDLIGKDVGGIAVHIAARVMALAQANEIWVSRTVKDLVVGSGFEFSEQGVYSLKGIPEEWRLFSVER